jgi:hypothetical protein
MPKVVNLKGKRFGKLLVLRYAGQNEWHQSIWWTKCKCGVKSKALAFMLVSGKKRCCRPCALPSRGMSSIYPAEHMSFTAMKGRCQNPHNNAYKDYGGRGITICKQWCGDGGFLQFVMDMGRRPKGKTLDRRNPEGNYCQKNCRWAGNRTQQNNRRCNYTEEKLERLREEAKSFEEHEAELNGTCF